MPAKITKCAQYTMEALVPFFMQDAQRQACFGLEETQGEKTFCVFRVNLLSFSRSSAKCSCHESAT